MVGAVIWIQRANQWSGELRGAKSRSSGGEGIGKLEGHRRVCKDGRYWDVSLCPTCQAWCLARSKH